MTFVQRNPHRRNLAAMQFEPSKPPYIPPGSRLGGEKGRTYEPTGISSFCVEVLDDFLRSVIPDKLLRMEFDARLR